MEVRIELNTEKNQVKKTTSTCQPKAGHKYNRPITSFKHSENFQYLATRVNKPKLHLKKSDYFPFHLLASQIKIFCLLI